MKDDQVNGRSSNISGQVKEVVRKSGGDKRSERKDTLRQVVRKKPAVYGDLKSDLRRCWVMY